jgi:hypothetical protein
MEGRIQLSLILEVDYRRFLEREFRGTRRGGKLSRADREAIEQKVLAARVPQRESSPPPVELSHKEPASSEVSASSSQQSTEPEGLDLAASAAGLQ